MKIAIYTRVSTEEQTLAQQEKPCIDKCVQLNAEYEIFGDKISGSKQSRPYLDIMMQRIRKGEFQAVMVYKLDRLGRSLKHLIQLIEEFNNKQVQFICLSPELDTKTASGRFFLQIIGAVAELEREMIRERTKAKLDNLRASGRTLGRPIGSKDKKERRKSGYILRHARNQQKEEGNNKPIEEYLDKRRW